MTSLLATIPVLFGTAFSAAQTASEQPITTIRGALPPASTLDDLGDLIEAYENRFDFDGRWQTESADQSFIIRHDGRQIWFIEAVEGADYYGKRVLTGSYSGESAFIMRFERDASGRPLRDYTIEMKVQDPDTMTMNGHTVYRVSPPKLNDIPCARANPRHVTARGAIARSRVSADAGDPKRAACWAGVAGKDGDPDGEYLVATYLRQGNTSWPKDLNASLNWMLLSAKQGNIDAEKALGEMYARGEGTPPDPRQSMYWFQQAQNTYLAQHRDEIMGTILRGFLGGGSSDSPSHERTCVVGASPGPNPHMHIQTYCRTN